MGDPLFFAYSLKIGNLHLLAFHLQAVFARSSFTPDLIKLASKQLAIPAALLNRSAQIRPKYERQFCEFIFERAL